MSTRLYTDLAYLWPSLSPPEDYEAEAEIVREILDERLSIDDERAEAIGDGKPTLVEFGAGGGHSLLYLTDEYEAVAVDLSPTMLENCRKLNPDVETVVGDMRTVQLGRTFDVVLIHDAVDYLTCEDDVRQTLANAYRHLNPGGVLIVAPTYVRETFVDGASESDAGDLPGGGHVAFLSYVHDPDPDDTRFELILIYAIREQGQVRVVEDRHACGLFSTDFWLAALQEAGFPAPEARDDPAVDHPHVLLVAQRR